MPSVGEAVVDVGGGHGEVVSSRGEGANPTLRPWEETRPERGRLARGAGSAWLAGVALQLQQREPVARCGVPRAWPRVGVLLVLAGAGGGGARFVLRAARPGAARLRQHRLARRAAAGRGAAGRARRARPARSPASSPACRRPARTGCASASRSSRRTLAGEPVAVPRAALAGLVQRLPRGRGARAAAARAARRPALALQRAAAPAARQPQPARLRLRAVAVRAGRARHRLRARRAAAARWTMRAGLPGRAAAPARARRDRRARGRPRAPPACWPRWRSATRRPSSARTGSCSASPAWRT